MALGRAVAMPLVLLLFILYAILLGLAAWAYNHSANGVYIPGANNVTRDLALISLISGVLGMAAVFAGLHHGSMPASGSRGAAAATSVIATVVSLLTLGIASKHIHIGHVHNRKLRALEAFAIIPAFFQLLHTIYSFTVPRGRHSTTKGTTRGTTGV